MPPEPEAGENVWFRDGVVHRREAMVSCFDRGFLFGDGVYEGLRYFNGVGVGMDEHVARLALSLDDAAITGFPAERIVAIGDALLEANGLEDAFVYIQVSRGTEPMRQHRPSPEIAPTVFGFASDAPPLAALTEPATFSAIVLEDPRWSRCSIKSTSLLANVLAGMEAGAAGADEAILHRDEIVTEGTTTNVFVMADGALLTPTTDATILRGVTRGLVVDAAAALGLDVRQERLAVSALRAADEIFVTSSRKLIGAIGTLDGRPVADGHPGPFTVRLFETLRQRLADECRVPLHLAP